MQSHSIFSSVFRKNLGAEKAARIGYDLVAGFSYVTVIPSVVLSQFSHSLSSKGIGGGLLGMGLAAGAYFAYTDVNKINEDNEKILKNYLFLLLYTSHIFESNHLFDLLVEESPAFSLEQDEKKQVAPLNASDLSAQDQRKIEILRELKETGSNGSAFLTPKQGEVLQRYLLAMRTQTEDNFAEFYKSIRNFHVYKAGDTRDSADLREFWRLWEKEKFFSDNFLAKALIQSKTWEDACRYYVSDYQQENLKHLQKQILGKLKNDKKQCDAVRFMKEVEAVMDILSKTPLDEVRFSKSVATLQRDFSGGNSQFQTELALYLSRLTQLKEKIERMTELMSPFYDKKGLSFLGGFESWLIEHAIAYYFIEKNSKRELLEKAFVWAVSSLGVYDSFYGLSANTSQEDPSLLFDWTRVLVGCVSVAVGTLVWNKLEKIDKMRQTFFSRLGKQLDELQLLVKSDKTFMPLPIMEPVGALSSGVSQNRQALEVETKVENFRIG